jgi:hypothetical protein
VTLTTERASVAPCSPYQALTLTRLRSMQGGPGQQRSRVRAAAPALPELQALAERIGSRLGKHLERRGILVRDVDDSYLALDPDSEEDALPDLQGHSINYRIALGRRRGQKAFTLQTLAPLYQPPGGRDGAGEPDALSRRVRAASLVAREDRTGTR